MVTGALKLFFRELPEPLVPYEFFNPFIEAISKCPPAVLSIGIPRIWVLGGTGPLCLTAAFPPQSCQTPRSRWSGWLSW